MRTPLPELVENFEDNVQSYLENPETTIHPYDISELLLELREYDESLYLEKLSQLPEELKALVLIELPKHCHEEVLEYFTPEEIADLTNSMDTDDAAELIRNIEEVDEAVADEVLQSLPAEDRENLQALISYGDYEAGAYMQTELFSAFVDEQIGDSIRRLKKLKAAKELDNVYQVYVIDRQEQFLGSIALEDLILLGPKESYEELVKEGVNTISVQATEDINNVVEIAGERVTVTRNYPFHGGEVIVEFDNEATTYVRHDFHLDRVVTDA